jgi:hypothetical protein
MTDSPRLFDDEERYQKRHRDQELEDGEIVEKVGDALQKRQKVSPKDAWTSDTVMTFGKFKGITISEVPAYYLRFLAGYFHWDAEKRDYVQDTSKPISFYGNKALKYLIDNHLCFHCGEKLEQSDRESHKLHRKCREEKTKSKVFYNGATKRGRNTIH